MEQSRRDFIKKVSLGTAGLAIGLNAKNYSRIIGSNDRVNFAVIGLHGRASAHLVGIKSCSNTMITHVCDVDSRELDKFAQAVQKELNYSPFKENDFRKLLELKDIDAITIAAPEHWHAPMAIMGLQTGKHIFVEKPSHHNPREGELLVKAQKKYGKLVQMGNQQRSSDHTIEITNKIKAGLIGRVYWGRGWYTNTRTSIGIGKEVPVPDYLDWDLWQGPAPRRSYKDNIHPYNWHWFWHWGTGEALNNGTHEVDLCRWILGVDYPNRVTASGGRYHYNDDWEFYDTLVTNYEYDDKMITWESLSCQGMGQFNNRGRGVTIHGTEGTVLIDRDGYETFDSEGKKTGEFKTSSKSVTQDITSMDLMTNMHFQNFVKGIRVGEKLHSPIDEASISVDLLLVSNIAWKVGRSLNLKKENGYIINDEEAMKFWEREYEKGWKIMDMNE